MKTTSTAGRLPPQRAIYSARPRVEALEQRLLMAVAAPSLVELYQRSPKPSSEETVAITSDAGRVSGNASKTNETDKASSTATVEMTVQLTKPDGSTLSSLAPGDEFVLHILVNDLRQAAQGVFAGFLDVLWDGSLAVVSGAAEYGPAYGNFHEGDFSHAGSIDDAGAVASSLSPLGAGQRELFSIHLRAVAVGTLVFSPDPADRFPFHYVLVYGTNGPVPHGSVDYRAATITISADPNYANTGLRPDTGEASVAAAAVQEAAEGESSSLEGGVQVPRESFADATRVIPLALPVTIRAGEAPFARSQSGGIPFGEFQIPARFGAADQNLDHDCVGRTDDWTNALPLACTPAVLNRPNIGVLCESTEVSINALDEIFTELGLETISCSRVTTRRWLNR